LRAVAEGVTKKRAKGGKNDGLGVRGIIGKNEDVYRTKKNKTGVKQNQEDREDEMP